MSDTTDAFIETGLAVVEDALDPAFCEAVIARRLADIGVDEHDPTTWRIGWHNLAPTTAYRLEDVAPRAAQVRDELVGGHDRIKFGDLPDNLVVNFPDGTRPWWSPDEWQSPAAGWHKDGDWFRHFLDSPEQGLLGIVLWRDVTERQGATFLAADSIAGVARLLADHPEGIDPPVPVHDAVARSQRRRALTGRQGTVVFAHPFLVHSASVNATDRLRIISNTSVMLRSPLDLAPGAEHSPLEMSILRALDVAGLEFRATRERARTESKRATDWAGTTRQSEA